jgi:hypothetical protein
MILKTRLTKMTFARYSRTVRKFASGEVGLPLALSLS